MPQRSSPIISSPTLTGASCFSGSTSPVSVPAWYVLPKSCVVNLYTDDLLRLMPLTRTTLTASSLPRLPRTHMSMARPCRQPCSNSSSGGRITDRLRVSVTPVVVSRIPPLAASPSKSRTSAGCLHQLDRVWCARRGFIDMILPLYRVFCLGPHITPILIISISVLVLSFLCCFFHPKESVASWSRSLIPSSRDKSLSVLSFFPPSNPKSYVPLSALVLSSF